MSDWLTMTPIAALGVIISAVAVYAVLVALVRLVGLRSFSKMSSFDFAITVAIGSVMASAVSSPSPSVLQASVALGALFGVQYIIALVRRRTGWGARLVDNEPLLLMRGRDILHDNLRRARVTEPDLRAKLREANVLDLGEVRAVVLEATGDISVLHGPPDGAELAPWLLEDVRPSKG